MTIVDPETPENSTMSRPINSDNIQLLADVPYKYGEVLWGVILLCAVCLVNSVVLWVVSRTRELWDKPRHLWMACLCITDIFVAAHKALELFLVFWPIPELCILMRTTLGIPYVVNVCLLALLSVDRFVAVRCPFFYSNTVSTKHVLIGFSMVMVLGLVLTILSMTLGLRDHICRPQPIQLVIITTLLTVCSVLIFFCNLYVLRIAKKQMDAIQQQEARAESHQSSFSNHIIPRLYCQRFCPRAIPSTPPPSCNMSNISGHDYSDLDINASALFKNKRGRRGGAAEENGSLTSSDPEQLSLELGAELFPGTVVPISLPMSMTGMLPQTVVLPPVDLNVKIEMQSCHPHETTSILEATLESHHRTETLTPLSRAISLPSLPRAGNVILVIPSDPTVKTTAKILTSGSSQDKQMDHVGSINSRVVNSSISKMHLGKFPEVTHTIKVSLPRSRSFTGGKKFSTHHGRPVRHNFLKSFHLTGAPGLSHQAWRLVPSRRFANTVLVIMIPMWLFLAPIVVIIPMQRRCLDQGEVEIDCHTVNKLWSYLQIHMRSILPLQAVLDTLIYACASKEFRRAFKKYFTHSVDKL